MSQVHESSDGIKLIVDVHELLSFFDESGEVAGHASAIKGVAGEELGFALLLEYFRRIGVVARRGPWVCTTGNAKGHRLDGWIVVSHTGSDLYYQVEVKTWSQHSLGGLQLPVSATPAEVMEFKKKRWRRYWLESETAFKDQQLAKVLTPMKVPTSGVAVEPLACLWDAMHPMGESDPFFTVPLLPGGPFAKVHVFSMSGFLRGLREKTLELDLPDTRERLKWLSKIFLSVQG
jgi:hypothetical protein